MGRRILIVEDEPAFAEVLTELLLEEGYSAVHVRDGVSALNALLGARSQRWPDLILCDVMLPGLRGDRLAAEVRARFPKQRLPILLMSASADPRVKLPEVRFIPKPFDSGDLLSRIELMLVASGEPGAMAAS
jgi:two-component system response regulator ResD